MNKIAETIIEYTMKCFVLPGKSELWMRFRLYSGINSALRAYEICPWIAVKIQFLLLLGRLHQKKTVTNVCCTNKDCRAESQEFSL